MEAPSQLGSRERLYKQIQPSTWINIPSCISTAFYSLIEANEQLEKQIGTLMTTANRIEQKLAEATIKMDKQCSANFDTLNQKLQKSVEELEEK